MLAFDTAMTNAVTALGLQLHLSASAPERQYPYRLRQALAPCDEPDLGGWLATQSLYPKFFWRSRDQHTQVAALGCAVEHRNQQASARLQAALSGQRALRYYWLSGFDSNASSTTEFPQQLLFVPQIELSQEPSRELSQEPSREQQQLTLSVVVNAAADAATVARQLRQLRPSSTPKTATRAAFTVSQRQDSPDFARWQQAVTDAKHSFTKGYLQKVVLARQSRFVCQPAIDFWSLFTRWQQASVNSYQIGYQLTPTKGFISFTPERLFLRDGLLLTTEAVAGTLPRSADTDTARAQAQALLDDSKNRHEHNLVVVEIGTKLAGLGVQIGQHYGTGLLKLAGLQHLQQVIQGQLPQPDMDAQLLRTLHPSAAVGGLPAANARDFILQHEPLARGLYAGCCGYFSSERSELAVTIRSAKLDCSQLTLYAGAGIVPQSDPVQEWRELEQKIAVPLTLLDPADINANKLFVPASDNESSRSPSTPSTPISQGTHVIRPSRLC